MATPSRLERLPKTAGPRVSTADQRNNSAQGAGAVYVFTRAGNTWVQQAYVKPSNPDAGDMFGYSVALSRDGYTLAVSSFDEDGSGRGINPPSDNRNAGSGAAYVFARVGSNWSQQAYIKPSNSESQDSFGVHIALSDDGATLLAGSLDEDCPATGVNPRGCDNDWNDDLSMGAAYVFVRAGGTWAQQAFLKPSNTGPNDWFGARVALSGDGNTAAIAAPFEDGGAKGINGRQDDESASQAGAVYVFTRAGTTWQQRAYVKGSNTDAFDEFGSSVALDRTGTTLVASAKGEDSASARQANSAARGVNGDQSNNAADEAGAVYAFAIAGAGAAGAAQLRMPDLILTNGKVVTVDERFSIAQAVAIGDGRIIAVGTDKEIQALAGRTTRRVDLAGKTVVPGLIDNHMHLLRAGTTWQREVRLDGVPSRKQALDLIRERAKAIQAGEWIYTLGGWTLEQFADDERPFTPAELDRVAPANPVFLQASYYRGYANTLAMKALGLEDPSGVVQESSLRGVAARLPVATGAELESSTRQMIQDLNRAGLTAFGSAACEPNVLPIYRRWAEKKELNVRVFCITGFSAGTPQQVSGILPQIRAMKVQQGDTFINQIAYGETVYSPLHDPMFVRASSPQPRPARRVAARRHRGGEGWPAAARARQPDGHDRRLSRSDRADRSRVSDPEPALDAGARQPDQRRRPRTHEEARDGCCRPSVGGDQRRHQPHGFRACCDGYGAAQDAAGQRRRVGTRQRRQPRESDSSVSDAVVGSDRPDGRRPGCAQPDTHDQS